MKKNWNWTPSPPFFIQMVQNGRFYSSSAFVTLANYRPLCLQIRWNEQNIWFILSLLFISKYWSNRFWCKCSDTKSRWELHITDRKREREREARGGEETLKECYTIYCHFVINHHIISHSSIILIRSFHANEKLLVFCWWIWLDFLLWTICRCVCVCFWERLKRVSERKKRSDSCY